MIVIPNRWRVLAVMSALALAGGLFSLVLLSKHTQAQPPTDKGNGAVVEKFPFALSLDTTGCVGGEVIDITGTVHSVNHFVPVQRGYHAYSTFSLVNARGVGQPTGDEYVISARTQTVENFLPTGDKVTGDVTIETDIGKGSSPDRVIFATVHYILTEDGMVKAEVIQFFVKCSGGESASPSATASAAATTP
jgi:hypothetical protein